MRYQGSKFKLKDLLNSIIILNMSEGMTYVEPFAGGCNSLAYINALHKIGGDTNRYIIALWKELQEGTFLPPKSLTREEYYDVKQHYQKQDGKYSDAYIGYVAMCCSYGASWFGGYAKYNEKRKEDHILEAYKNIMTQVINFKSLENTTFVNCSYDEIDYPQDCFIYCDPPYNDTKKYANSFDSDKFYNWVREMVKKGHTVLMSEYTAPNDFVCVWSKTMQDGMASVNQTKVEKLFVHSSQVNTFKLPPKLTKVKKTKKVA